jgi:hypothetical protein
MFHPWLNLRALPHITVHWLPLDGDIQAVTDGHATICMDPRLLQVERRCSLTHELVHIERGHTGPCNPKIERQVRRETARRLVTITDLIDALKWSRSVPELADELWVTVGVLMDRIDSLSAHERQLFEQVIRQHP